MLCLYDDALCSIICTVMSGTCQSSICDAKQIKPLLLLLLLLFLTLGRYIREGV